MNPTFYKIVESADRGKIVVAAASILSGQVFLKEDKPLFHLSDDLLRWFEENSPGVENDPDIGALGFACFYVYNTALSSEERMKFNTLFGPATGDFPDQVRGFAEGFLYHNPTENGKGRQLTPAEVTEYARILNVIRLNMISAEGGGRFIFGELTRFAHSCGANCVYEIDPKSKSCFVRALCAIAEGEELTISYNGPRDQEPTHIRRQKYLETKEFTCHCPRCDAPGDDTRQFDCFDPACKGVMMVCQPINKEPLRRPSLQYTGVEYVEPHLLPCTECHRAAPTDYQTKMFALEPTISKLAAAFASRYATLAQGRSVVAFETLQQFMDNAEIPRRHLLSLPMLSTRMHLCRCHFITPAVNNNVVGVVEHRAKVQRAALEYLAAQESVLPRPDHNTLRVLQDICDCCIVDWIDHKLPLIFLPAQAKELMQKMVRMMLILNGRQDSTRRDADVDAALLKMMAELPQLHHEEVCAYCEESPLRAAITLSYCGRCKKVCYCSAGCQKAHWMLHKRTCSATNKEK